MKKRILFVVLLAALLLSACQAGGWRHDQDRCFGSHERPGCHIR